MYAVVKACGRQYKVSEGDVIVVDKIEGDIGATVELGPVLMAGEGESVKIGAPHVDGKKVTAKILRQAKGTKVTIIKHRRRNDYRLKKGHRQLETTLQIVSIN
ncbi:MAG: 50S ribosomal protein L21 [Nitrospinae bacterium]|nr:50S ribosomal protein L21 [Nitrospinota bacterium]